MTLGGGAADTVVFELPLGACLPSLVEPNRDLVEVADPGPADEPPATVIDTVDRRLISWGMLFTQRVVAGVAEWRLQAERWTPHLPSDRTVVAEDDEVPLELADAIRAIRRGGILGSLYTMNLASNDRRLIDHQGRVVARLTDQTTTFSAAGQPVIGVRELRFEDDGLEENQHGSIMERLTAAGAVRLRRSKSLAERLGCPQHRGRKPSKDPDLRLGEYLSTLWEREWRILIEADLESRAGAGDDRLRERLAGLRSLVSGVGGLLDEDWARALIGDLDAVLAADPARPVHRSPRYQRVFDGLDQGVTTPPPGQRDDWRAASALRQEIEGQLLTVIDRCRHLDLYSYDARWDSAHAAAKRTYALVTAARPALRGEVKPVRRVLGRLIGSLRPTATPDLSNRAADLKGLTTTEVFEAGRAYERIVQAVRIARGEFLEEWPALYRLLRRVDLHP